MKKIILLALLVFLVVSQGEQDSKPGDYYTIKEAQVCFHSQALPKCQTQIQSCLSDAVCQQQTLQFRDCNFEAEPEHQIFNGNCFRDWKQSAVESKQMINCIDEECNLAAYNSDVSLGILYQCSQEALFQYPTECDEVCQTELSEIISDRLITTPIREIYENPQIRERAKQESTRSIIEIIKKECIERDGSIRLRQEADAKEKARQKMQMQKAFNEQLKVKKAEDDPSLQSEQSDL